jgi:hypothetical protein
MLYLDPFDVKIFKLLKNLLTVAYFFCFLNKIAQLSIRRWENDDIVVRVRLVRSGYANAFAYNSTTQSRATAHLVQSLATMYSLILLFISPTSIHSFLQMCLVMFLVVSPLIFSYWGGGGEGASPSSRQKFTAATYQSKEGVYQ